MQARKIYVNFRPALSKRSFRLHSEVFLNSSECMQPYGIQLKLVNHLEKYVERDLYSLTLLSLLDCLSAQELQRSL